MNASQFATILTGVVCTLFGTVEPAWAEDRPSVPGTFSVSSSGSANYVLPIQIVPAAGGTAPAISLVYDSQTLTSPLGAGWTLSGYSMITRGPRTRSTDGAIAAPTFGESDALYLDGQRLLPISRTGSGAARVTEYRKEYDDVTQVVQTGTDLSNSTFRVRTKGGMTLIFDGSRDSRVHLGDGSTLMLLQSSAEDTAGNYFLFFYDPGAAGDYVLREIQYTGNRRADGGGSPVDLKPFASVLFEYGAAPRSTPFYVAGRLITRAKRLASITSRMASARISPTVTWQRLDRYVLEYEERNTFGRFVLSAVRRFGRTDAAEAQPTRFTYSAADTGWTASPNALPAIVLAKAEHLAAGYRLAKVSGSASPVPDLLFSARINGALESFTFENDGKGNWTRVDPLAAPIAFATDDGLDLGAELVDLNGDGKSDLLQSSMRDGAAEKSAYLADAGKWTRSSGFELPFAISENGKRSTNLLFGNFSGSGRKELVYHGPGASGFLLNDGTKWLAGPQLPVSIANGALVLNADCAGGDELLIRDAAGVFHVLAYRAGSWQDLSGSAVPAIPAGTPMSAVRTLDLNNDQCPDVLAAVAGGVHSAWIASSAGWTASAKVPTFDLVDAAGDASDAQTVDLNGDGLSDIVAHRQVGAGKTIAFAHLQTATGWAAAGTTFIPEQPLGTAGRGSFLQDINGDPFPDALFATGGRTGFGAVFTGSASGFQPAPNYAPAVAFARLDRQDRGVRFIDLNGDGLTDLLFSRKDDGANAPASGAFLNTAAGWKAAPGLVPPLPLAADDITDDPARFADVDGDGYLDLLYAYRRNDGSEDRKFYRNELGADGSRRWSEQAGSPYLLPAGILFSKQGAGDTGTQILDLNGDGRPDLIASRLKLRSEVPAGTTLQICETTPAPPVCRLNPAFVESAAYLNGGSGWVRAANYDAPAGFVVPPEGTSPRNQPLYVQLVDLTADGLPDVVARFKDPYEPAKEISQAWRNTGTGWVEAPELKAPVLLDETRRTPRAVVQWMDLNADGVADIVYSDRSGGTNLSKTWLGTGTGFVAAPDFTVPLDAVADRGGDPSFRLIDANGDGLADIIYARRAADSSVQRGFFVNTGSAWLAADPKSVAAVPAVVDDRGQDLGVRFFDITGDGLLDVIRSYAPGGSGTVVEQQALTNTGRRSELLETVDAGHTLTTRISYQSLQEPTGRRALQDHPSSPWERVYIPPPKPVARPLASPTPVTYVVRRATIRNGSAADIDLDYRYGDYLVDVDAMRSIGFGWRETLNAETRVLTRTEFALDHRLAGKPLREATCIIPRGNALPEANTCPKGDRRLLTELTHQWQTAEQALSAVPGERGTIRQNSLKASISSTWELDGTLVSRETTSFEYDEPGNVADRRLNVRSTSTVRSDGTSLVIVNSYDSDDPARWILGRLTASTSTKVGDVLPGTAGRQKEIRKSAFTYHSDTGLLLSETTDPDEQAVSITKRYTRDDYGNIVATETSALGLQRRVSSTYDDLGRFETRSSRPAGARVFSTTRTHDRVTGALLSSTDDNNQLQTRFQYDGFERLSATIAPNGVTTTTRYLSPAEVDGRIVADLKAILVVSTTVGTLPSAYSVLDGAGRQLRSATQGFTPNPTVDRLILQDAEYDAIGRVTRTSLPYDMGGQKRWTAIVYDALDRRVKAAAPDSTIVQKAYSGRAGGGRRVTVTDSTGRRTTTEFGARGQMLVSTDALGASVRLGYDAADHVTLVTAPNGAKTRTEYVFGRKVRVVDPDMGTWRYEYDGFGQLTRQTDGNGTSLVMTYDDIGRPLSRSGGNVAVSWDYDGTPHGVGQVTRMVDTDRYEKTFAYDTYGRLESETVKIAGEAFTTSYEWDKLTGAVTKVAYPTAPDGTPVNVLSMIDAKGAQYRITDDQGSPLWEAVGTNALGQFINERYGAGTSVSLTFDEATGRASNISAKSTAGGQILDLALDYDAAGNLKRRREKVRGVDEQFGYDDLYRLVQMTGTSGNFAYVFDPSGRIKSATNVGSYSYRSDVGGPAWAPENAVVRIANGAKRRDFAYDGNGSLLSDGTRTFKYDSAGRLVRVSNGSATTTFDYDPNGVRYRQVRDADGYRTETIYVGSFERRTEWKISAPSQKTIRSRYALVAPTGVIGMIQIVGRQTSGQLTVDPRKIWYIHRDNLGSVVRITDQDGRLAARAWYSPWGKQLGYTELPPGAGLGDASTRGFTGHEQFFGGSFVHMNGRVYDPETGLFIMADPVGNDITDTQSVGRFAYARGNPLSYTDPSGYFNLFKAAAGAVVGFFTGGPGGAIAGFVIGGTSEDTARWIEQNWREIVIVAAAAAVTVVTAGSSCAITCAIIAGAAGGATAGGLSAALYGGDVNDVIRGAFIGGAMGALTAGTMGGIAGASTGFGSVVAHGAVGGAFQAAQGGDFWQGFAAAAVARASTVYLPASSSNAVNVARAAAVGGAASSVSGGKFFNGAATGALSAIISYAYRRFGPAAENQGKGGNIAFVGGAGDEMTDNVKEAYDKYAAAHKSEKVVYFTWDQSQDLEDWIKSNNGDVTIFAHSYGADTAAAVVGSGVQVKQLITVDPVSRLSVDSPFGPSFADVKSHATEWIHVYASPAKFNLSDYISGAGGAWGSRPGDFPTRTYRGANDNHADFQQMLDKARGQ